VAAITQLMCFMPHKKSRALQLGSESVIQMPMDRPLVRATPNTPFSLSPTISAQTL
jgi:hypothetical protein